MKKNGAKKNEERKKDLIRYEGRKGRKREFI